MLVLSTEDWIRIVAVVIFTLVAAVIDFRTRRIPNWLTVPAFVAAILFHVACGIWDGGLVGGGWRFLDSLGGFCTGFGILFVLMLIGGGGAGDVKLMGAVGTWLGAKATLMVFLFSTCFAVLGTVLIVSGTVMKHGIAGIRKRYARRANIHDLDEKRRIDIASKRRIMTYALPVALAVWLVLALQDGRL